VNQPLDRLNSALAGRYDIQRELGGGGMSRVFLATETALGRDVVVKVISPDVMGDAGADRFAREVKLAARLQHANIVPVLTAGDANGLAYYTMPMVRGETVRERLQRGAVPPAESRAILRDIARALAYAHGEGIVHRDIKPENVLLSGDAALVTDFGIAKAIALSKTEAPGGSITQVGASLGTPGYMAPEQAAGDEVDARADLYAWGVMAYELLNGRHPFADKTTGQQLIAAHIVEKPKPLLDMVTAGARRDVNVRALAPLVMQCLEKQPAARPANARAVLDALETPVAEPSSMSRGRFMGIGVAALVVVSAIAAYVLLNHAPATAALQQATQLTRSAGVQEMPRISSDGKAVAYRALSPGDSMPHVEWRRGSDGSAVSVLSSAAPMSWSPDGDRLLVMTRRGLESVSALGGASTLLVGGGSAMLVGGNVTGGGGFSGGVWAPDGLRLAYVHGDSLLLKAADGGVKMLGRSADPHSLAWSPDGAWIAYVSDNARYLADWNIAPSSIWIVPSTGGMPTRLTTGGSLDASPTWAPDSRRLLFTSNRGGTRDIYQLNVDRRGRAKGDPVRVTTGLNASLISLSADGRQLAYSVATNHSNIWSIALPNAGSVSSRAAELITSDKETIESLTISADGQWLLFDSDRAGLQQIFKRPLAGGALQQVTRGSAPAFSVSISPDSRFIAFHTIANGLRRVFVASSDGGDRPTQVSRGAGPDERNPVWSPDGSRLAWQMLDGAHPSAIAVDVATRTSSGWGAVTRLELPSVLMQAVWLGERALMGRDSLNRRLLAVDIDRRDALPRELARDLTHENMPVGQGSVSTDGRTYLMRNRRGIWTLPVSNGGVPRQVVRFDDPLHPIALNARNVAMHAGRLYFTLQDPESNIWVAPVTGLAK